VKVTIALGHKLIRFFRPRRLAQAGCRWSFRQNGDYNGTAASTGRFGLIIGGVVVRGVASIAATAAGGGFLVTGPEIAFISRKILI